MKRGAFYIKIKPKNDVKCYKSKSNNDIMKSERLINGETKGLVAIMQGLSELNKQIAVVYSQSHDNNEEIEDNKDYITAQSHIHSAIYQLGEILGKSLAEKLI